MGEGSFNEKNKRYLKTPLLTIYGLWGYSHRPQPGGAQPGGPQPGASSRCIRNHSRYLKIPNDT